MNKKFILFMLTLIFMQENSVKSAEALFLCASSPAAAGACAVVVTGIAVVVGGKKLEELASNINWIKVKNTSDKPVRVTISYDRLGEICKNNLTVVDLLPGGEFVEKPKYCRVSFMKLNELKTDDQGKLVKAADGKSNIPWTEYDVVRGHIFQGSFQARGKQGKLGSAGKGYYFKQIN